MKETTSKQNTTNSQESRKSRKQMSERSSKCSSNSTLKGLNTKEMTESQQDSASHTSSQSTMPHLTVLSVRRNYKEDDPLTRAHQHFVHYKFQPGLGFYGFGLIHLIGSIAKSSTSILRQLIDAGTLANLPAGFKASVASYQGR